MLSLPPSGCEQLIQNALTPAFHYSPRRFPTVNLKPELNKHSNGYTRLKQPMSFGISSSFLLCHIHTHMHTSRPRNVCRQVCCCHLNVYSSPRHGAFRSNQQIHPFPPSLPPRLCFCCSCRTQQGEVSAIWWTSVRSSRAAERREKQTK